MTDRATISVPRIVGDFFTTEWFASRFVTWLTQFISLDMDFGKVPLKGDLSEWIQQACEGGFGPWFQACQSVEGFTAVLELCQRFARPSSIKEVIDTIEKQCSPDLLRHMIRSAERRDFEGFKTSFETMAQKAGLAGFSALEICALVRATQATIRCLTWYRISPLALVKRAYQGDQEAVLDLVRVDRLFMLDRCTQEVLREAVLGNNQPFMKRLARIERSRPRFRRRQACEFYFYALALLGIRPRLARLRLFIDPDGEAFPRLYDFDKCFERRRDDLFG
jgi:hypothetical protein